MTLDRDASRAQLRPAHHALPRGTGGGPRLPGLARCSASSTTAPDRRAPLPRAGPGRRGPAPGRGAREGRPGGLPEPDRDVTGGDTAGGAVGERPSGRRRPPPPEPARHATGSGGEAPRRRADGSGVASPPMDPDQPTEAARPAPLERPEATRSIEGIAEAFRGQGYIAERSLATTVFLALELGRPAAARGRGRASARPSSRRSSRRPSARG